MKLKIKREKWPEFFKMILFLVLAIVIIQLYPDKRSFNYHFEVGKPWTYDMLTAPFDFPIYKTEEQLDKERKQLLRKSKPYYLMDSSVVSQQMRILSANHESANVPEINYLRNKLQQIYSQGVVSVDDYQKLRKDEKKEIVCIMPNRIVRNIPIGKLHTPKTVYEEIFRGAEGLRENLKAFNLNTHLVENLRYDSITSESSDKEILKSLSRTNGMMQAGEKIIDRGEVISPRSYQIISSLKLEYENQNARTDENILVLLGEVIIVFGLIVLLILYLYLFRTRIFESYRNLLLIILMMIFIVGLTALILSYTQLNPYIVPFLLLPIVIRVFFDSRTALFVHIITTLIISFIIDNPFQFVVLQITAGMTAVSSLRDLSQRSQLAQSAFYIFISYVLAFLGLELISEGDFGRIHWMMIVYFAISSLIVLFAHIFIFFIEKLLGLISNITLLELTNINSDFMIKFAEEAPGTFQHTLQVSNLATEAAKKINANSLLVRTGALYHDIGKIKNPYYFTENQMGGSNPLLNMDSREAARIIINHVPDGIQLAKKNNLPEQIINFIATHHGTSTAKYFYNACMNQSTEQKPDKADFMYPGPRPNTKETAILMMADAVEARSRSLKEYTPESIDFMVEDMIDSQIADGQFKDSPISFQDVELVKSVFKEKIKNMYHTRISYPELKVPDAANANDRK